MIPWARNDSTYENIKYKNRQCDADKTIFVGGLHGMLTAQGLAVIMNDLFKNVIYAGNYNDLLFVSNV